MKKEDSKNNKPYTLHSIIWSILLITAMACLAAVIGKITPNEYDVSVMFVIGWWCSLIWDRLFP